MFILLKKETSHWIEQSGYMLMLWIFFSAEHTAKKRLLPWKKTYTVNWERVYERWLRSEPTEWVKKDEATEGERDMENCRAQGIDKVSLADWREKTESI